MNKRNVVLLIVLTFMLLSFPAVFGNSLLTNFTSYYSFEESSASALAIDSRSTNYLNPVGSPFSMTGKIGNTRAIDSSARHFVNTSTTIGIDKNANYSYSMWVYRNASETSDGIYLWHGNTSGRLTVRMQNNGCTAGTQSRSFAYEQGAASFPSSNCSTFPLQQWQHVVLIYDGTNQRQLTYINGSLTSNASNPTITAGTATGSLSLGSSNQNGYILDEVGIWNRTLTNAEVSQLWNSGSGLSYAQIIGGTFSSTARDFYDNQILVNFSLSVNGSNYNQTFYTTNSSVVVYPLTDMSGNNKNITNTGANWTPYGAFGGAYTFRNPNMLVIGTQGEYNFSQTDDYSISAWVNFNNTVSTSSVFSTKGTGNTAGLFFFVASNKMYFGIYNGSTFNLAISTTNISSGVWYHVGAENNATHLNIYINGVLEQNTTHNLTGTTTNSALPSIGNRIAGGTGVSGTIDEIYFFNRTLSSSEWLSLARNNTVATTNLLSYYPFENITSTSSDSQNPLADKSLNGNTLTNNGAQLNGTEPNTYYYFNGVNGVLNKTGISMNSSYSFAYWLYPNSTSTNVQIWNGVAGSSNALQQFFTYSGAGTLYFRQGNGSTFASTTMSITNQQWVHVCGAYDGTRIYLYKNGVHASNTTAVSPLYFNPYTLTIGSEGAGGNKMQGNMDNVAIYQNRNITASECLALANNQTPNPNGLVAYYDFNTAGTLYNFTVDSEQNGGYFSRAYQNTNVSTNLQTSIWQSIVGFSATEKFTGNAITGVQANVTNQSNTSALYLKAGSYTATLGKSGYYNEQLTFTANASTSSALVSSNWTNAKLNVTGYSLVNGQAINIFNVSVIALDYGNQYEEGSTTNGTYIFNLTNGTYNVSFESQNYTLGSVIVEVNGSLTLNNQSFGQYTTNSVNITYKDERTGAVLTGTNITVQFIGDIATYTQTNATGYAYIDLISPDNYTIRYNASGYIERFYYFEVTNRSALNLTLYLANSTDFTNVTATVYDQYGSLVEGAFINVFRYDFATNDYLLVEITQTNFLGQATLSAELETEYYKFIIEYPNGEVRLTTTPTYLYSNLLTFVISLDGQFGSGFSTVVNVDGQLSFNTATNNFRFEYLDDTAAVSQACVYVYRVYGNVSQTLYNSTCSTSSSDILLTWVDNSTGALYKAQAVLTIDGEEVIFDELWQDFRTSQDFSVLGLFATIMVTITWVFVSRGNPVVLLVGAGIPLLLTTVLGWTGLPMWIPLGIELLLIVAAYMISKRA